MIPSAKIMQFQLIWVASVFRVFHMRYPGPLFQGGVYTKCKFLTNAAKALTS